MKFNNNDKRSFKEILLEELKIDKKLYEANKGKSIEFFLNAKKA